MVAKPNMKFFGTPLWKIFVGPKYRNGRYLFLILIPHLISAVLEGASFAFILLAFSSVEGKPAYNLATLPFIKDFISSFSGMQLFYLYILAAILLQAFRSLITYLALYGTSLLALKIQTETQRTVYQQIFKFTYSFLSKLKMGDLSEYIKNPSIIIPVFFDILNRLLVSSFMAIGLLFVLYFISPLLTILTAAIFTVFALAQKKLIKKVTEQSIQLTSHLFEFSHQTIQSLQGIRLIYIFQKQKYVLNKIENLLNLIAKSTNKVNLLNNLVPTINETASVLLVGGVLILGSWFFAHNGQAVLSNLLTYIALTYRLATRLQICMSAVSTIGTYYGSLLRVNEVLDEKDKEFIPVTGKKIPTWNKEIEFRNVSLLYPGATEAALNNVTFSIKKGMTVAFVGLSGAGKSSALDLILGLQKPVEGTIFVDSENLSLFSSESWLNQIGVVSQDTFLFNDTIEENVRFGHPDANEKDVQFACDLAGASDFIEILPHRFKTIIGERGHKLSGGERQRIALARALLRNPQILILDEATSNLDSYSERQIQKSLDLIKKDKTLIIVAHRLSTITHADQIFVLEKGEIIERGNHEELILKNGLYQKLWELQSEKLSV